MKVLLVNGSPKANGNTARALAEVAEQLNAEGIDTEVFQLGAKPIRDCIGCGQCINVCPTGALQQEKDGRITMRVQFCVACKMCIAVCPYGTISLDTIGMPDLSGDDAETIAQRARREVAVRCDMCRAWREENGKKITACMEACPVRALSMVEPDGTVVEAPQPEKKPVAEAKEAPKETAPE